MSTFPSQSGTHTNLLRMFPPVDSHIYVDQPAVSSMMQAPIEPLELLRTCPVDHLQWCR